QRVERGPQGVEVGAQRADLVLQPRDARVGGGRGGGRRRRRRRRRRGGGVVEVGGDGIARRRRCRRRDAGLCLVVAEQVGVALLFLPRPARQTLGQLAADQPLERVEHRRQVGERVQALAALLEL